MNINGQAVRRWALPAAVATAVAVPIWGCGASDDGSAKASGDCKGKDPVKVGIVMKAYIKDFWIKYRDGALAAGKATPCVTTIATAAASETDAQGQIAKIQGLITQGVDAIVVAPISQQVGPVIKQARSQGVKIIFAGDELPGVPRESYVGPSVADSSKGGAKYLLDKVGAGKPIAILTAPGIPVVEARVAAAKAYFQANGGKVVSTLSGGQCNQVQGQNSTQDLLRSHPDIAGIWAACSPPDLGAIQAITQDHKTPGKDVTVVGYDGSPQEFEAISKGTLSGAVYQLPLEQGKLALKAAVDAARGEKVASRINSPYIVVDRDNVSKYQ